MQGRSLCKHPQVTWVANLKRTVVAAALFPAGLGALPSGDVFSQTKAWAVCSKDSACHISGILPRYTRGPCFRATKTWSNGSAGCQQRAALRAAWGTNASHLFWLSVLDYPCNFTGEIGFHQGCAESLVIAWQHARCSKSSYVSVPSTPKSCFCVWFFLINNFLIRVNLIYHRADRAESKICQGCSLLRYLDREDFATV